MNDNGKERIKNGEGEGAELPEPSAPPPFPEEEWKQQEALRQLEEEAARHQRQHLEELSRQRQQSLLPEFFFPCREFTRT